jgi:dTDP-4-dehydrorhamnose reductase
MKIVVTGANGQVGREFLGIMERGFDQHYVGYDLACFTHKGLDITDATQIEYVIEKEQPQLLINCAAYTNVDEAESDSTSAFSVNEDGARNLAIACKKSGIALIHISTDYVFNGDKKTSYVETDLTGPLSVYGASKLAGELAIAEVLKEHIILRTAWIFGEYGNNFVKTMLRLGADQEELSVVSDQLGAPTSAKGIADCCMLIASQLNIGSKEEDRWGVYHYCGQPFTSWHGFAMEIFRQAEEMQLLVKAPQVNAVKSEQYPTLAKRPNNSKLECSKLLHAFNISPDIWKKRITHFLRSYKQD